MNQKQKRTVDKKLLSQFKGKGCLICHSEETTVAHHIITKGSGGPDILSNLMPLCYIHHAEIHKGLSDFVLKYKRAELWLLHFGWELYQKKWLHPKQKAPIC